MSDPSASSSEKGFTRFRAADVVPAGPGPAGGAGEAGLVPPPLPPPPPGVTPREGAPGAAAIADRPSPPPIPAAGASRSEAWGALVDWCVRAGVAEGGLLARRDGTIVELQGPAPVADAVLLSRRLCAALAAAREAGGREPVAAAFDLGGAWITGFAVPVAEGVELVAGVWGRAPLRGVIRAPLARWLGEGLARTVQGPEAP